MSDGAEQLQDPFVVACIPAFNEEGTIARVVLMAERYVGRVVVCDDGSVDLTGAIAEGLRAVGCGISGTLTEIMNGLGLKVKIAASSNRCVEDPWILV